MRGRLRSPFADEDTEAQRGEVTFQAFTAGTGGAGVQTQVHQARVLMASAPRCWVRLYPRKVSSWAFQHKRGETDSPDPAARRPGFEARPSLSLGQTRAARCDFSTWSPGLARSLSHSDRLQSDQRAGTRSRLVLPASVALGDLVKSLALLCCLRARIGSIAGVVPPFYRQEN